MYVYTYVGISRMLSKISTESRFTLSNAIDLMYFGLAASALKKTVFRCQPSPVTTAETAATTSVMSATKIVSS